MRTIKGYGLLMVLLFSGFGADWSRAQSYPMKPIRMIIPFAPGGGVDIIGRTVASEMSKAWGQNVVVDNEPGASGTIGLAQGTKAAPDGYTLTMVTVSTLINQYVLPSVPYNLLRDFAPLSQLSDQPFVLVVHASVPARNLKQLIALAKANPGKLNYSSSGVGGAGHLAGALFSQMAGIDIVHVPYKGGGPAMVDLVAGYVQMQFSTQVQAATQLKSGRLRALGVTTPQRAAATPDVPTMSEAGLPDYEIVTWQGVMLPLKTPQAIIAKLNQEIARIMRSPEVLPRLAADGSQALGSSPEQFGAMLKAESVKWSKLVKDIGLKAE